MTQQAAVQDPKALIQAKPEPEREESPLEELLKGPMKRYDLALEPQSEDYAMRIAQMCADTKLAGCSSVADAYLRIIAGRALGLPAMASVQSIFPVDTDKGVTLGMYVKTKLALALSHPEIIEYVRPAVDEHGQPILTDKKAMFVGKRVGGPEVPYEFTIENAETAGLVNRGDSRDKQGKSNNNYNKYPKRMLAWRACGALLDLIAGDILHGIASVEDVIDERETEPPRGELPAAVKDALPARDWAKESLALRSELDAAFAAKDSSLVNAVRKKFAEFSEKAPSVLGEELLAYYNELATKYRKPRAAASQTPAPAAVNPAPPVVPPSPATAGPAAGAPATYLPPHKRGDAYDGPDEPPVPFGNT